MSSYNDREDERREKAEDGEVSDNDEQDPDARETRRAQTSSSGNVRSDTMNRSRTSRISGALKSDRYGNDSGQTDRGQRSYGHHDDRYHRGRYEMGRNDRFRGGSKRGRGRGGFRYHDYRYNRYGDYRNGFSGYYADHSTVQYEEEEKDDSPLGRIKQDIRCVWDEEHNIVVFFRDMVLLQILADGRFEISCPLEERNEESACVIDAVLRPFNLRIMPQKENDYSSQWYLSDGKDYKVKCLEKSTLSGPASQVASMNVRTTLVAELIEAGCLFTKASVAVKPRSDEVKMESGMMELDEGVNVGDMKVLSPVQALRDYFKKKGWESKGSFWFDRVRKNGMDGYNWTIRIKQFDVTIGPTPQTWNQDKEVAKNLAAENALNVIRAIST